MRTQVLRSWTEVENLVSDRWDDLVARSGSDPLFLSYEWMKTWWSCFGQDKQLFVILAEEGEDPVAIAPLCIAPTSFMGVPARKLQFLAGPDSDYLDFVVVGDRRKALWAILSTMGEAEGLWDWAEFLHIPEESPNLGLLPDLLSVRGLLHGLSLRSVCPYVEVDRPFAQYFDGLGRRHRESVRRKQRKLEGIGPVRLQVLDPRGAELEEHFAAFWSWRRVRQETAWRESGIDRVNEAYRSYYRRLLQADLPVHFSSLMCGPKAVAYHFGFVAGGKFYYYTPAFDPEYAPYSPGNLLIRFLLEHTFAEGLKEFDFLLGDEEYKFHWAQKYRKVYNLRVFRRKGRAYPVYLWLEVLKPRLQRSMWLRQSVRKMRRLWRRGGKP